MSQSDASPRFLSEDDVLRDFAAADASTLEEFWARLEAHGTPLQDPDSERVTFLRRNPDGFSAPGAGSRLWINRVTEKADSELGVMRPVPGTDIWVRTLDLSPTLAASYGFVDSLEPPQHNHFAQLIDPLNPHPPILRGDEPDTGLSLFAGRLHPTPMEWAPVDPALSGRILREDIALGLGDGRAPERRCVLYLPEGVGEAPLLTLFDGEIWFDRLNLPHALEQVRASGRLPGVAVLAISSLNQDDRRLSLGANDEFLQAVATQASAWARDAAGEAGVSLVGNHIAGQSLGGLSALRAVQLMPDVYRGALCQSPSMWWTPDGESTPRNLGEGATDWITREAERGPVGSSRLVLEVGTGEAASVSRVHQLHLVMRARGWDVDVAVRDGGHDWAWWREGLIDYLADAL